jgi:hypothetical protein
MPRHQLLGRGWKTELMQGAGNRYELAVNTSGGLVVRVNYLQFAANYLQFAANYQKIRELQKIRDHFFW